jgi:hypothetical protein
LRAYLGELGGGVLVACERDGAIEHLGEFLSFRPGCSQHVNGFLQAWVGNAFAERGEFVRVN